MSSHTISHADRYQAGNAVAFNKPEEFKNNLRGLPILMLVVESFPAVAAANPDGVAESQTPAAGGQQDLTLDGAFVTDGIADLPLVSVVSITSSGADNGRTFTVIGSDANGRPQAEEIPGPNAGTSQGVKSFSKVSRIFVDADTAGAITAGQSIDQVRGLRTKAEDLREFFMATEDGVPVITGTFDAGNITAQTAITADQRADYQQVTDTVAVEVMYLADLTKEGIGENYTDSSQRVPSAI
jgi:hypothetical protein